MMEGVNEVNRLKEMVAQNERGGFNLRNQSDQYQRDGQRHFEENQRIKNLLEKERSERDDDQLRFNSQS